MWNVFPFHPHKAGNQRSNRPPARAEVEQGRQFLQLVLDILCPHTVVAVGHVAAGTLARLFPAMQFATVRHPSHGGEAEFIAGVRAVGLR